jgi:hypothetical protein
MYVIPDNPLRDPLKGQKEKSFPWVLTISLAVNVAFLSYTIFQWQDGTLWLEVEAPSLLEEQVTLHDASLEEEIAKLATRKDEELLSDLDDTTTIANGYRTQELALALLRSRGYQVEDPLRPLSAWPQQLTPFSYHTVDNTSVTIYLFSKLGLADVHAVKTYLESTPVPFIPEKILEKIASAEDPSLLKVALFRTDEWAACASLFPKMSEEDLLALCKEMGPQGFSTLVAHARKDPSIPPPLLSLFQQKPSPLLAEVLVANVFDSVLKAPDATVLSLISVLNPHNELSVRFAIALLKEQRKPQVWQAAGAFIATATSTPSFASMTREELLLKLSPKPKEMPQTPPPPPPVEKKVLPVDKKPPVEKAKQVPLRAKPSSRFASRQLRPYRVYMVKKGDTLWSIAKRFNVDVEKLKYLNNLKGTSLPPGRELRIPH